MGAAEQIATGIYLVGEPEISHAEDATAYLIDFDADGECNPSDPPGGW